MQRGKQKKNGKLTCSLSYALPQVARDAIAIEMFLEIDGYSLEETVFSDVGGQHTEHWIRRLQSTFTVDGFVVFRSTPDAALLYERLSKIYYCVSSEGICMRREKIREQDSPD